jgi:hypothetical protein
VKRLFLLQLTNFWSWVRETKRPPNGVTSLDDFVPWVFPNMGKCPIRWYLCLDHAFVNEITRGRIKMP